MRFIEINHDYGCAYISRHLLFEASYLYVESSHWNDETKWYVRVSGDAPDMIFDTEEAAVLCYESLKGFVKD